MTIVTLKQLMDENGSKFPKAMNIVLKQFAKEQGLSLTVEGNFPYVEREEDLIQGVSLTADFEKTLSLLGVTMTPSLNEVETLLKQKPINEVLEVAVSLSGTDIQYEGLVFEGTLNQTLSLWLDVNELKEKK